MVKRLLPIRFRWLVLAFCVMVAVTAYAWRTARTRRERLLCEGVLVLALAAAIQYVVVALLQGPVAVSKGMLLFAFLFDVLIVSAIAIAMELAFRARRARASSS